MKTTALKLPLFAVLLACAALAPRRAAAQLPLDSYTITILPGQNLIANQLDTGDNTLNQVLPLVAPGSQCLKWDDATGTFSSDSYDPLAGWTDSTGMPSTTTLGPRDAAFLFNPAPPYDLVFTGSPRTNSPPPPLARGVLHYVSGPTKATATIADFHTYCCNNPDDHCALFLRWNPASQSWLTNMFADCHWSLGEPTAAIGEAVAFWLPTNPPPPVITCPPDLTVLGCDPETPVSYRASYGTNKWISCFPPSGTLFTIGTHPVTCAITNDCGYALSNTFQVTVRPPVARFPWPSPLPGLGIPIEPVGGATVVYPPAGSSSTEGPSLEILPNPSNPNSGVRLTPGPAQAITFTTILDFTAPVGAGIDIVLPPHPMNTNNTPLLSFRNKGAKGYCVKTNKKFADDPSGMFRLAMVNTNGQLLATETLTTAEMRDTEYFVLAAQPGVASCHVTIEVNLLDGGIALEFDGPVTAAKGGRKGWDGCIYGPDRPIKKTASRLYVGPPPFPGAPPITELYLYASGMAEVVIEEPTITARGRRWGDGHVTLMKAYDDGAERGMEFTPLTGGGGMEVDLGYTASFDLRLHHLDHGDIPSTEYLLTRTIGPIALTNRPPLPKPYLDAMRFQASSLGGVECSADFNGIGSPTVLVQIYNQGILVAQRAGVLATLDNPILTLPDWPVRLGKLSGATPCRRGKPPIFGAFMLPGGSGTPPEVVMGDEFRVLAELPPDAPHPDYYGGFEFTASAGSAWAVTELATVSALQPGHATVTATQDGRVTLGGATEGFLYMGAESVLGPWYNLGFQPPSFYVTGTNAPPPQLPQPRESPSLIFLHRESPTRCCRGGQTILTTRALRLPRSSASGRILARAL